MAEGPVIDVSDGQNKPVKIRQIPWANYGVAFLLGVGVGMSLIVIINRRTGTTRIF